MNSHEESHSTWISGIYIDRPCIAFLADSDVGSDGAHLALMN